MEPAEAGAKFSDEAGRKRDGVTEHGRSRMALDLAILAVCSFSWKSGVHTGRKASIVCSTMSEEEVVLPNVVVDPKE